MTPIVCDLEIKKPADCQVDNPSKTSFQGGTFDDRLFGMPPTCATDMIATFKAKLNCSFDRQTSVFLGCYRDNGYSRDLNNPGPDIWMTRASCAQRAADFNFTHVHSPTGEIHRPVGKSEVCLHLCGREL